MINLDYINGYLNAMCCLNAGLNHYCDYSMKLLNNKGNFTDTLAHHFQSITDGQGQCFDAKLWHINPKPLTVDEFIQQIDTWFFQQYYSPTVHKENGNWGIAGFIDMLLPIKLNQCYLYEIETKPPIWYATRWCDLVIAYQNDYYLLHLDLDD